jgi:hypothetical protein
MAGSSWERHDDRGDPAILIFEVDPFEEVAVIA